MFLKKCLIVLMMLFVFGLTAKADAQLINTFAVKENPFGQNQIAIAATDTNGVIQENINGDYKFSINGFDETLTFDSGTAFYHKQLEHSSFIYLKHTNTTGTHSFLYYVYKSQNKLIPIQISWIVLVGVPLFLILICWMFRKLIIIGAVLLFVFIYFNYHSGLTIPTFFETIIDGVKHLFAMAQH